MDSKIFLHELLRMQLIRPLGGYMAKLEKAALCRQRHTLDLVREKNDTHKIFNLLTPEDDLRHVLLTYACVKVGCTVSEIRQAIQT